MASRRRRYNVVIEDFSDEMLNATRDAERRALESLAPDALRELRARADRVVNEKSGNYRRNLFAEASDRRLELTMGARYSGRGAGGANHAHLIEYGTGPRQTRAGANRGQMPKPRSGVIRFAALKMRRQIYAQVLSALKRAGITR